MLFCTQAYLIFFLVVYVAYWWIPWQRLRVYLLVAASIFFYAKWSQWLALLVTATTVLDYALGRVMESATSRGRRRFFLALSLTMNLGLLGYFKYVNFFLDALRQSLQGMGVSADVPYLRLLVPFGISFYTFEAISYSIDVFRGKIKAEKSLPNFMLFILFFPHLIAGPIVRARDFLTQAARPKRFSWLRLQCGIEYFLIGAFKKLVIADGMALYSDVVFGQAADPSQLSCGTVWLGVLAFAIQIYCDFSGYSDMALGCAHMLGYKLAINFRMPYLATNISDFWRRWHISLSSWLRDYLFIPLGGSRGSWWLTSRNLLITMSIGGLWHGASWSYLLWGAIHGVLLIVHRGFRAFAESWPTLRLVLQTWIGTAARIALTFFCVMMCWVFFQPSLPQAVATFERMVSPIDGIEFPITKGRLWFCLAALAVGQCMAAWGWWKWLAPRCPAPLLGCAYALLLTMSLLLSPDTQKAFIYFVF